MKTESSQKLSFNYFFLRTYTALSISSTDGLYVSEYFLIRKFFFADSKISTFTRIRIQIEFAVPARIRLESGLSGFTLGKLVTKLSMRRKAREIWQSQPGGKSKKNEKSKVDSSMDKRENLGTRFSS